MTKTQMATEMLDANYEPAYRAGGIGLFNRYGFCEKTKARAFNKLKYHTAGSKMVENLYRKFKEEA